MQPYDGRSDFDFIFGTWQIANRRLADRGNPQCVDWIEFETTSRAYPIFDGLAHVDLIEAGPHVPGGPWQGLTLRQFDPTDGLWRIWWSSSLRPGHLDPPLSGSFVAGVGTFAGDDELDGQPIKLRFEWRNAAPDSARWQQSFSFDGGQTWVANWTMDFTRRA